MEEAQIIISVIVGLALAAVAVWEHYRFKNRLKDILREHLTNPRWNWRTFEGLKRAIHEDDETTTRLLFEIGARRSETEKDVCMLE
jgi:hypothetical protein